MSGEDVNKILHLDFTSQIEASEIHIYPSLNSAPSIFTFDLCLCSEFFFITINKYI